MIQGNHDFFKIFVICFLPKQTNSNFDFKEHSMHNLTFFFLKKTYPGLFSAGPLNL